MSTPQSKLPSNIDRNTGPSGSKSQSLYRTPVVSGNNEQFLTCVFKRFKPCQVLHRFYDIIFRTVRGACLSIAPTAGFLSSSESLTEFSEVARQFQQRDFPGDRGAGTSHLGPPPEDLVKPPWESRCTAASGVPALQTVGPGLLPPLQPISLPKTSAFLPPGSAQDNLSPGNLENRGLGHESKDKKPLERHPSSNLLCWARPSTQGTTGWGHSQLSTCRPGRKRAKKGASGKIPACESGLP